MNWEKITEKMAAILDGFANLISFGETYNEICAVFEELNQYQKKKIICASTGKDWEDCQPEIKQIKTKTVKKNVGKGVFGRTWDEIEKMQGGKIKL
jgi:hypothetical protein